MLRTHTQVIHVGPLQEEGVVGMGELGVLVRETAFSAYKGLKRSLADYSHPYVHLPPQNLPLARSHAPHTHAGTRCDRG